MKSATVFVLFILVIGSLAVTVRANQTFLIPDTGQTACYDNNSEIACPQQGEPFYGQDANYNINPPSYVKLDENGNDLPYSSSDWVMVRDIVTGLIWEVKTDDDSVHDRDYVYTWNDAQDLFIAELNSANFGGFSDWRLPTVKELITIVNNGISNPAANINYFPYTIASDYYTSTIYAGDNSRVWRVGFGYGWVGHADKTFQWRVRAVRGREPVPSNLVNNYDGTVTDYSTGLMWQQDTAGYMDWESALSYCENLVLAGYDDWHLPNYHELLSIVDYSKLDPAIDVSAFPDTVANAYWSSTTLTANTRFAFQVHFGNGYVGHYEKPHVTTSVRAVRNIIPAITVISPNGGEQWTAGTPHEITWTFEYDIKYVKIEYSINNGSSWTEIVESTENNGSYDWQPPCDLSDDSLIKISDLYSDASDTSDAVFSIIDNIVPDIEVSATPDILWPPNHKMVQVTTTVAATDNCDTEPVIEFVSIVMNESDETITYDPNYDLSFIYGLTSGDIQIIDDFNFYVRCERSGKSNGRTYTITYKAIDDSGNESTAFAEVLVPHSM